MIALILCITYEAYHDWLWFKIEFFAVSSDKDLSFGMINPYSAYYRPFWLKAVHFRATIHFKDVSLSPLWT